MTVAAVLGLAVLDTLSPAVVGVTIYLLLARPRRVGLLLAVYLATVAAAYFVLGVVLMLGLGAVLPAVDPTVRAWVQGGIGVALFAGSWFIPDKEQRAPARPREASVAAMVLLGVGTWLFEFATALPYFGAIGIMTSAELEPPAWLALLAAYVAIMVLPGVALFVVRAVLRDRVREPLERWQRKLDAGSRTALSWVVGIVGALLVLDALPDQITISTS